MRILIGLVLSIFVAAPALSQSTPPPLPGTTTQSGTMQAIGRTIFTAVEKAAIEKFFGRSATPSEQILIDAAKDAVLGTNSAGSGGGGGTYDSSSTTAAGGDDNEGRGKGKGKGKGHGKGKGKNKGLPPGLAKKKQLPPGLQKRLAKHGSLPPGLAKRDLPADLEQELPPAQPGTDRIIAGNDVVLVDQATNVVLDILYDVVTGTAK